MSALRDIGRLDRSQLDLVTGLRAAVFALTPLALGLLVGQVSAGAIASLGTLNEEVVSTLGAINVTVTEPGGVPLLRRVGPPALGCLINAVAFSLGTLVGVSGMVAVPLVAAGVFLSLMVRLRRDLFQVGIVAATVFVVGVGLPGGSVGAAYSRFWLILAGGLWAFFGAVLQWLVQRTRGRGPPSPPNLVGSPTSGGIVGHSLVVAATVAAGLWISDHAGLARDYWVMLTVIVCVRLLPTATVSFTLMRVLGTVAGAALAFATTLAIGSGWPAALSLFLFGVGMFSTRYYNFMVFSVFLTAFIIVLLNLAYPGNMQLALVRILDTCLGGALSLVASAVLWAGTRVSRER